MLDFRILGPLEVVVDGQPVRLGGPRQRATLAILLLDANRVVSVDRLADALYAGDAPVTAVTQIQRQISALRKVLGTAAPIETRPPGYVITLAPEEFDLTRFERDTRSASDALARGDADHAAALLRDALNLWRGPALGDFVYEPFAQTAIERLEEMRLAALEQRIEADLALERHSELVAELEGLARDYPLRERFRGQLMVALYRSGRQADALDAYKRARETLSQELGIEPSRALRQLERLVLTQDASLDSDRRAAPQAASVPRSVLVVALTDNDISRLVSFGRRLTCLPGRELILVRLARDADELAQATSAVSELREAGQPPVRTAACTSNDPAGDVLRFSATYDVALLLLVAPDALAAERIPPDLARIYSHSASDVAIASGAQAGGGAIAVPFGGGDHDWAALELAAWLALATREPLRLVGTSADPERGRRDASRLLADASLAVQRVVGIDAEPRLAEPSQRGLLAAVEPASIVVAGVSDRWRRVGIGDSRRTLLNSGRAVILVHRGLRPGGLAPPDTRSRFTWTIDSGRYLQAVS